MVSGSADTAISVPSRVAPLGEAVGEVRGTWGCLEGEARVVWGKTWGNLGRTWEPKGQRGWMGKGEVEEGEIEKRGVKKTKRSRRRRKRVEEQRERGGGKV